LTPVGAVLFLLLLVVVLAVLGLGKPEPVGRVEPGRMKRGKR